MSTDRYGEKVPVSRDGITNGEGEGMIILTRERIEAKTALHENKRKKSVIQDIGRTSAKYQE